MNEIAILTKKALKILRQQFFYLYDWEILTTGIYQSLNRFYKQVQRNKEKHKIPNIKIKTKNAVYELEKLTKKILNVLKKQYTKYLTENSLNYLWDRIYFDLEMAQLRVITNKKEKGICTINDENLEKRIYNDQKNRFKKDIQKNSMKNKKTLTKSNKKLCFHFTERADGRCRSYVNSGRCFVIASGMYKPNKAHFCPQHLIQKHFEKVEINSGEITCKNCGTKFKNKIKFCENCGIEILK